MNSPNSKHVRGVLEFCYASNPVQYRKNIFSYTRAFPYQINGLSSAEEVATAKAGYCVSKHRILQRLFADIGIRSELCFVPFTFGDVYLPKHLAGWGMATKKRYHVFLKATLEGHEVDLDASFPLNFRVYYPHIQNRDGYASMSPFFGNYTTYSIPQTKEQEKLIKQRLMGDTVLDKDDERRIDQFNDRSLSVHSS